MAEEEIQEFHLELASSTNKGMTIYCNYAEKKLTIGLLWMNLVLFLQNIASELMILILRP